MHSAAGAQLLDVSPSRASAVPLCGWARAWCGGPEGRKLDCVGALTLLFVAAVVQARLLCIAVVQAFFSTSAEAQEEVAELVSAAA